MRCAGRTCGDGASRTLILFLKQPVAGRVKSRLGRAVGMTAAAWWFRHQSVRLIRDMVKDPRWRTILAVDPVGAEHWPCWPAGVTCQPQGRGDLGQRMRRALLAAPRGRVVLIGADIPGVTRGMIARAHRTLGDHDAVLGPAEDGGFWLVGLNTVRSVPRGLFDGVRWSGPHAMADTIATMTGLRVGFAPTLADVDTINDLRPRDIAAEVAGCRALRASRRDCPRP